MSTPISNKQICQAFYALVGKRRFAEAMDYIADGVVWWVQGDSPVSGFHHGKTAVSNLFAPLAHGLAEDITFEFGALTAEDDRVAMEMTSSALLTNGARYENNYHLLITVRDGKIASAKEYLDTKILDALLNAAR